MTSVFEDFGILLSAITAAMAIVGGVRNVLKRLSTGRVRAQLEQDAKRLHRLDLRLAAVVVELDARLAEGVPWEGWDIWPARLKGWLIYLDNIVDETFRLRSELRAIEAVGATERLRDDVEDLARLLSQAASLYLRGTLDSYQRQEGAPVPLSAGGRELTATLPDEGAEELADLREDFTRLMRTVMYRLEMRGGAERYEAWWPVQRWECERIDTAAVWRSEPRPLEW